MTQSISYKNAHMYVSLCFLIGFLSVANTTFLQAQCSALNYPGGRIALSFDGNDNDEDDIIAMPMSCAILEAAGLTGQVVHLEYSNHIASNGPNNQAGEMETSIQGCINRFGIPSGVVYNAFSSTNAARNNLANEISASTANNKLWIIAAGPMETVWRAFNRAVSQNGTSALNHVTVISHSPWNENYTTGSSMTHDWNDLKNDFGNATFVESNRNCQGSADVCTNADINNNSILCNQNCSKGDNDFNTPINKWNWLTNLGADYTWLFNRNPFNNKFDPSDAGMVYYLLTGGPGNGGCKDCGWPEVKSLFENPCSGGGGPVSSTFFIEHRSSGRRLKANNSGGAVGTNPGGSSGNQVRWEVVPTNGDWFFLVHKASGKKLFSQNGTNVTTGVASKTGNKVQWKLVDAGGGWYRIQGRASGKWLHVQANGTTNFSLGPTTWTGNNTQWKLVPVSNNRLAQPAPSQLVVYPNPTQDILLIEGLPEVQAVEVFNLMGASVLQTQTQAKLDVSSLPSGIYLLKTKGFGATRFVKQ